MPLASKFKSPTIVITDTKLTKSGRLAPSPYIAAPAPNDDAPIIHHFSERPSLDKHPEQFNANPLASPQRETSGAQTFEKYEYQYHWALCRVLSAHETLSDYVVFIELHEDVVFADSTDVSLAQFEFNQVKNVNGNPYTVKKLTSCPKSKNTKEKNSILGKMLLGLKNRPFHEKVYALNLIATCGFNLTLKAEGLSLAEIRADQLHPDCLKDIHSSLSEEMGTHQELPKNFKFIKPSLPSTEFQDTTIGRISRLVPQKIPGSKYEPQDIYRSLIDDLHRKGMVACDFSEWDPLIKRKGLTHADVDKVISAHTTNRGIELMMPDFEEIAKEKELQYHKKIRLRRAFERYHSSISLERTLFIMDRQQAIKKIVDDNYNTFEQLGTVAFIDTVLPTLLESKNNSFSDPETAEAALIYELISKNHGI